VAIAGRIWSKRWSGQKLVFYDLRGDGSKVQVMADAASDATGKFMEIHNLLRRGDIIGVIGYPGRSKRGELSIFPREVVILSPCM